MQKMIVVLWRKYHLHIVPHHIIVVRDRIRVIIVKIVRMIIKVKRKILWVLGFFHNITQWKGLDHKLEIIMMLVTMTIRKISSSWYISLMRWISRRYFQFKIRQINMEIKNQEIKINKKIQLNLNNFLK